jgi:hypothetical protein
MSSISLGLGLGRALQIAAISSACSQARNWSKDPYPSLKDTKIHGPCRPHDRGSATKRTYGSAWKCWSILRTCGVLQRVIAYCTDMPNEQCPMTLFVAASRMRLGMSRIISRFDTSLGVRRTGRLSAPAFELRNVLQRMLDRCLLNDRSTTLRTAR